MALVILALGPLLALSAWFQFAYLAGFDKESKKKFEVAGQLAGERLAFFFR